jgi:hypothetical protein
MDRSAPATVVGFVVCRAVCASTFRFIVCIGSRLVSKWDFAPDVHQPEVFSDRGLRRNECEDWIWLGR